MAEASERKGEGEGQQGTAASFAEHREWPGYFTKMAGTGPRETLLDALRRFDKERRGRAASSEPPFAIDLGAGEGRDTAELLRRGWRVLAIDGHASAFEFMRLRPEIEPALSDGRLALEEASFESCDLPPCDLLNCSFALPFCPPEHFDGLWRRVVASVRPGGRFAGQLFGDRDEWAPLPDRSHQTREEAMRLLEPFEIERFDEEEREREIASGKGKRWHVFHIVARKR